VDENGKQIEQSDKSEKPFPEVDINNEEKTVPLIKAFFDQSLTCNVRGDIELSKVKGTFGIQM